MHIQGQSRNQALLFPERLDDLIDADNPVRVIDAFVDSLDLWGTGVRAHGSAGERSATVPPRGIC